MFAKVRRGRNITLGDTAFSANPADPWAGPCSFWDLFSWANCASDGAAAVYQQAQYGNVPAPVAVAPPTPPAVDSTGLIVGSAQDAFDQAVSGSIANTVANQTSAINSAIASGSYLPGGTLPFTGSGLTSNGLMWLIVGGSVGLYLLSAQRGRA